MGFHPINIRFMGLENRAYIANDNGAPSDPSYDDRMGFNHFVKTLSQSPDLRRRQGITQSSATPPSINSEPANTEQTRARPPGSRSGLSLWSLLLFIAILGFTYLSLVTSHPASRIIALTGLFLSSIIAAAVSEQKQAYRFKAVTILIAIAAWVITLITLSQSFGLDIFSPYNPKFYITTALVTLAAARGLRSRLALIISVSITALWAYAVYVGYIEFSASLAAIPILAAAQVFISQGLGDGFSRRLAQLILYGWGLCALMIAAMSGFTTPEFFLSALTLLTGFVYLASTHPFFIWSQDNRRGTALLTWFALISCCLASGWLWIVPTASQSSGAGLSPMMDFIWQVGLITGALALSAAALFRNPRTSHSLMRRLMGAILIMIIAASHYFKSLRDIELNVQDINAGYVIAAMILFGGISIIVLSKFISAIRYSHNACLLLSSLLILALFAGFVSISSIDDELLYIAVIGALMTIFGLALTHKKSTAFQRAQTTYRPLKSRGINPNKTRQITSLRHNTASQPLAS